MGNGYIATTSNQKVYTTSDLITWVLRDSSAPVGGSGQWRVTNGGSRWLLSGSYFNGVTFVPWLGYSDDGGASWQDTGFTPAGTLTVAWGVDTWVAAGGEVIYASADGLTWDILDTTSLSDNGYVDQIKYEGAFVLVGGDDNGAITMLSVDGRVWNPTTAPTGWDEAAQVVLFGGTCFIYGYRDGFSIAVFGHSDDLVTWVEDGTFDDGLVTTDGTTLVRVGYDSGVTTIATSTDGSTWTPGTIGDIDNPLSIQYADGLWFGSTNHSGAPGVFKSTDASTWTTYNATLPGALPGVITDLQRGVIPYSLTADATLRKSPSSSFTANAIIETTVVQYVAVGDYFNGTYQQAQMITSAPNSYLAWTTAYIDVNPEENFFYDVAYGNNTWVAVGAERRIYFSTDGIVWSYTGNVFPSGHYADHVIFANNLFVTSGFYGIYTSPDGITWTQRFARTIDAENIRAIAYDGTTYAALGYATIGGAGTTKTLRLTSTDGVTWTKGTDFISALRGVDLLTYGNGTWLLIGSTAFVAQRLVYTASSPTGTWTAQSTGASSLFFSSAAYGDGKFVLGASNGTIWVSTNGSSWTVPSTFVDPAHQTRVFGLLYTDTAAWLAITSERIYWTTGSVQAAWTLAHTASPDGDLQAITSGQLNLSVKTFTADAIIRKTQSNPFGEIFVANAEIAKAVFRANAVLKKTKSGSATANAVFSYIRPGEDDVTDQSARNRHDRSDAHFGLMLATSVIHNDATLLETKVRDLWNRIMEYEENSH